MNIFDFDKTIYDGDSTFDFLLFCAKRHAPVRRRLPKIALNGALYILKIKEKQQFKEQMFAFLQVIDTDSELEAFWNENISKIKPWYKDMQRDDDIVISASPEFLVKYACDKIGIKNIMGSPVDKNTGRYSGKNCHGEEKVLRLKACFPNVEVDEFYSDSYSDTPLARLAKKAFIVKKNALTPWKFK